MEKFCPRFSKQNKTVRDFLRKHLKHFIHLHHIWAEIHFKLHISIDFHSIFPGQKSTIVCCYSEVNRCQQIFKLWYAKEDIHTDWNRSTDDDKTSPHILAAVAIAEKLQLSDLDMLFTMWLWLARSSIPKIRYRWEGMSIFRIRCY